jgi:cell division protein FtsI/penicillin-binding protein 2
MSAAPLQFRAEPGDRCLRLRTGTLCCGIVSVFSLFAWRLIYLQVDRHQHYRALMEETHHKTRPLSASRGDILDTRGRVLACDEPVQQISFEVEFLQGAGPLSAALAAAEDMKASDLRRSFSLEELQNRYLNHLSRVAAPAVGLSVAEFESKIRTRFAARSSGEVLLIKDLSVSTALKLRSDLEALKLGFYNENLNRGKLGALVFQHNFARRYPSEIPLKHIVGFFGENAELKTARGVAGVERFFESDLKGVPGQRELEVDGWGNEIPAYRGAISPPRNGRGVRLSLDLGLQSLLEEVMDETGKDPREVYLNDLKAERVIVVLFDPATMGVRAIGCRDKKFGPDDIMLTNPVSEMLYEPGSTIKIVTMAGAISAGKVNSNTRIALAASGVYDDDEITPITDEKPAATFTVEEILMHSSNIGAYKLARMLGPARFETLLRDFGFLANTGFESPFESRGSLDGSMSMQTMSRAAFGNAIAVTPAQMCGALGAIINDGNYQPLHLAESWVDETGSPVEGMKRTARRVISADAAHAVRRAMLQVIESGTGMPGRSDLFEIAGKTGTARKATTVKLKDGKIRSGYQGDLICSFIGFLPADKPKLAGLVIIDTPRSTKHSHYGGHIAAPLFRRVAERAMAYYQIPAQFSPAVKLLPQAASTVPVRGTLTR